MQWLIPKWPVSGKIKAFSSLKAQDQNFSFTNNTSRQQNVAKLIQNAQLPNTPFWLKQVHSNRVVLATTDNMHTMPVADASYTKQRHVVCAILTADCLPILICDKQATQVAAVHSGWKGLAAGILEKTLSSMQLISSDCLIWIGPGISQRVFEVGLDVYNAFGDKQAFHQIASNKWLADLVALAKIKLTKLGVPLANIYVENRCTYSEPDSFYSHRRSQDTGRMASIIWLD